MITPVMKSGLPKCGASPAPGLRGFSCFVLAKEMMWEGNNSLPIGLNAAKPFVSSMFSLTGSLTFGPFRVAGFLSSTAAVFGVSSVRARIVAV